MGWQILLPLLIELVNEWLKDGKPSKATAKKAGEAILSGLENTEGWDLEVLGKNMVIQGLALQEMAKNLKPSDGSIPPLDQNGGGLKKTIFKN